ncbi:MAG: site-2 protease family protein [Bacteroidota bacterium]
MLNQGISFRLGPFPTEIKASFLFLGLILYSVVGEVGAAMELTLWAAFAVLLHELGHAWAYQYYGLQARISLMMLGGVTYGSGEKAASLKPGSRVFIAFAGPLMSVISGVVLWGIIELAGGLPYYFLSPELAMLYPLFFTIGWGILNLIPIYPLDGGQILRNLLALNPRLPADKIASWVSVIIGGAAILYTLSSGDWYTSALLGLLLYNNFSRLNVLRDEDVKADFERIQEFHQQKNWTGVVEEAQKLIPQIKSQRNKRWVYRLTAEALHQNQNLEVLKAFMEEFPEHESMAPELKLSYLYQSGDKEGAIEQAKKNFALHPSPGFAQLWINLLLENHQWRDALEAVGRMKSQAFYLQIAPQLGQYFLQNGHHMLAADLYEELFKSQRNPDFAFEAARAYNQVQDISSTFSWLQKAQKTGLEDFRQKLLLPEFESLRSRSDYPF